MHDTAKLHTFAFAKLCSDTLKHSVPSTCALLSGWQISVCGSCNQSGTTSPGPTTSDIYRLLLMSNFSYCLSILQQDMYTMRGLEGVCAMYAV